MPVTYAWRDELEKKTQNALHRALGNVVPASRGGMMSRSSLRGPSQFDGLEDGKVSIGKSTLFTANMISRVDKKGVQLQYNTNGRTKSPLVRSFCAVNTGKSIHAWSCVRYNV